jgi:hypothetical protein
MNYLVQIKQLWRVHEAESLSTDEIAFYFYLLELSNKLGWLNPFKRNNSLVKAELNIKSYDKLSAIRNRLKLLRLIDFRTQNGNANAEYELTDLSKNSEGITGGITVGLRKGDSEVLPELSKAKTINLNKNERVGETISIDSIENFYQMFLDYFAENQDELKTMLQATVLADSTAEEIQSVILKFCTWYVQQKRVSPDFEKNKTALMRWFQKEKPVEKKTFGKLYAVTPTNKIESKTDQLRKSGLYE